MVPLDGMVDPGASGVFLRERARAVEPPLPPLRRPVESRVPPAFHRPPRAAAPVVALPPAPPPLPVFAVVGALAAGTLGSLLLAAIAIASLALRPEPPVVLGPIAALPSAEQEEEPEPPPLPPLPPAAHPVVEKGEQPPPPPPVATPASARRTVTISLGPDAPPFASSQLTCEDGYRRRAPFADGRVRFEAAPSGVVCRLGFLGGPVTTTFALGPEPSWVCTSAGGTTRCAAG